MFYAQRSGPLLFEVFDVWASDVGGSGNYVCDSCIDLGLDRLVLGVQINERYLHRMRKELRLRLATVVGVQGFLGLQLRFQAAQQSSRVSGVHTRLGNIPCDH